MAVEYPNRSTNKPLPELDKFTDPVLASIWKFEGREDLALKFPQGAYGHRVEVFNERYAYMYKTLTGFGDKPLVVGTYFQASDFPTNCKILDCRQPYPEFQPFRCKYSSKQCVPRA